MRNSLIICCLLAFIGCKPHCSQLQLPSIIGSQMVLQQSAQVALWGKARPTSSVKVSSSWGENHEVTVAADSSWILNVSTTKAGAPQQITIVNDDSTLVISDVLMGEVWLCSGQSNMEMPLAGWPPTDTINNSAAEIAAANYPNIRFFTVARNYSIDKLNDVSGKWLTCTPENAARFSGTAFHFGKKLHNELNIPIGLINSSWGGTPAESWITGEALLNDVDFKSQVENLKYATAQADAYNAWLKTHQQIDVTPDSTKVDRIIGLSFFDEQCASITCEDGAWEKFAVPGSFSDFDGVAWLRKSVTIPASWQGGDLQIRLGAIDDRDVTYFNGVKIGAHEEDGQWQVERVYTIPASLVKVGENSIAVKIIDTVGGGGVTGEAKDICITSKTGKVISLAGEWQYRLVAEFKASVFYLFEPTKNDYASRPKLDIQLGAGTPSMLYNAMIAPLANVNIKGVIWYQGESNVGRAKQYSRIFPLLIESWRKVFNQEKMPFYFVQIAPWLYGDYEGYSSAGLRDAQRRTLSLPNTGMAVLLDVDNQKTIHPGNKKEVGERLALWALAKDYGKAVVCSGPLYKSMTIENNRARLDFDYAVGGVALNPTLPNGFEIAGLDNKFYPAQITLDGESVIVSSPKVASPTVVRYGYKNGAKAALLNKEGLPASSFITSTDILE